MQASGLDTDGSHSHRYPVSRGPLIFLDKSGRGRDLPLPNFSRKIKRTSAQTVKKPQTTFASEKFEIRNSLLIARKRKKIELTDKIIVLFLV